MRFARITKPQHVATALLGIGSAMAPGRWNSQGTRLAYGAQSTALAMLEMLVHIDRAVVPDDFRLLTYEIPDDAVYSLPQAQWPTGWDQLPYATAVRQTGDQFIAAGEHLAMRVPSAVARGEHNLLINPGHPRFGDIVLISNEPLAMDQRLFG